MKILVTGGAGFIGSHLCHALVADGYEVTILDNLSSGSNENIALLKNKVKLVKGDIRNQSLVESLVKECDHVYHLAAVVGVKNILKFPTESIATNFNGSEVVIQAVTKYNKRLILASTSEIYGKNSNQPLTEDSDRVVGAPQKIRWIYSDAKALEEAVAISLSNSKNLSVTILRFFNTVGPRQTGRYGMVVPRLVESALNNKPITIYGNGKQSRVFCHVEDAISAAITCAKNDKSIGNIYNVGGKGEVTINQLGSLIKSRLNSSSKIIHIPYEEAYEWGFEDISRRVPDISKIKLHLGWQPIKSLNEIIDDVATDYT